MALVIFIIILVAMYFVAMNTGNTKKRLDIERRNAAVAKCPHCGEVGATVRSPAIGMLKVLTLGLFAVAFPGSRKCIHCGYKW